MDAWEENAGTASLARPLQARAWLAVAGIVMYSALYVVIGGFVVTMPAEEDVYLMDDAELEALTARTAWLQDERSLTLVEVGLKLASGVLFWMWMYRAYENVRALGREPDHDTSRAVWSWFVPFANLVWPYQIMSEIWCKSGAHVDADPLGDEDLFPVGAPPLLGSWWGFWVLRVILERFVDAMDDSPGLFAAYVLVNTVAAGLAVAVVLRLTARQEGALSRSGSAAAPSTF